MSGHADEHERTMAFAEIALGQIRALRQPATPRHFEIWYTYATGYNPSLNQMINEMLARGGTLSESDIDQIYDSFISPSRLTDRIDHVGSQVMGEIEQVMAMIGAAAGNASSYTESLLDVSAAARACGRRAGGTRDRRDPGAGHQGDGAEQPGAGGAAQRVEAGDHPAPAEPRNRPQREPDRPPHLARQPQILRRQRCAKAIAEARGRDEPLSLMMTDVDHFKKFNDSYGHLTGDQVLRLVAMSVKQNVKGQDIAARYGGEEFAVVLPNTVLRSAITVADHIRRAVMTKELMKRSTGEHLGRVTISIGVATLQTERHRPVADRTRRHLPLCGQARRPQPGGQRERSGNIERRRTRTCAESGVNRAPFWRRLSLRPSPVHDNLHDGG